MGANATTSVPTYLSGDVLTAANLNITNSGIPVFADAAARDAAFDGTGEKTLAEGQFAFLEDTNATQYYDGSVWVAVGGGGGAVPALKLFSGQFYLHPGTWNGTVLPSEDTTVFMPFFTPETVTFDRISCHTASSFVGTATVRLGLFQVAEATGLPGDLILDAGTVSCTASNTQYNITISQSVNAGMFYLAFNSQTNASTNHFFGYQGGAFNSFYRPRSASASGFSNLGQIFNSQTSVSGAFSNAVPNNTAANCPTVALRVA